MNSHACTSEEFCYVKLCTARKLPGDECLLAAGIQKQFALN